MHRDVQHYENMMSTNTSKQLNHPPLQKSKIE